MQFGYRSGVVITAMLAGVLLQEAASQAAEREVRIALSFPNGVVWPYFSVATQMGYAKEDGIAGVGGNTVYYRLTKSHKTVKPKRN
jgi:hypothetical protein